MSLQALYQDIDAATTLANGATKEQLVLLQEATRDLLRNPIFKLLREQVSTEVSSLSSTKGLKLLGLSLEEGSVCLGYMERFQDSFENVLTLSSVDLDAEQ